MVVIFRHGLFSCVHVQATTPATIAVRARVRQHLVDLLAAAELSERIVTTPTKDYHFRVHLGPDSWATLLAFLGKTVEETTNVKDSISALHGHDSDLYRLASDVWHLGLKLQHQTGGPARRVSALRRPRP